MTKQFNRGRPIDQEKKNQQKIKLIAAAKDLLEIKSYRSITIRELAEQAEVNSAMISYYFKNKEGLFIALVDSMAIQLFSNFQKISSSEYPVRSFIEMMTKTLSHNKGFARLIHDEILLNDNEFKNIFIERLPKKMAVLLPELLLKNTAITDKKRAKFAAFSLIMMIITPFIHEPVRKQAWGIDDQDIQSPLWIEHIHSLFMYGCSKEIS